MAKGELQGISGQATLAADPYGERDVVHAARGDSEPPWLIDRRAEGARAFAATAMPTPALRPWRYTDVSSLAIEDHALHPPALRVEADLPPGAYAGTIAEALDSRAEVVRSHLGSLVASTEGRFVAANAARWNAGVLVHLPRGSAVERPIVVEVTAADVPAGAPSALLPRILVVAEERSEATIVVRLRSGDGPLLVPAVAEISCADHALVRLLLDGGWGAQTREFTTLRARLGRSATLEVATLAIGGRLVKQTLESLLEGEGAHSEFRGVALGDGDQHFDFVTLQDHLGPRTTSNVEIKAALAGSSRSVYYGITRVEETAAGAAAEQENRNLLLSRHAKADSDPVLEILTSEVIRCGHGATVGPVDQEALFYLQSRGLDERTALQFLVAGFFDPVARRIPLEGLGDELAAAVHAKLASADLS
ncbi:MAG: Fe-S cluster assembly protein SufD [Chloroflexi bacterium]|nr:Fe-S cluster assembly protein SufD [Chloroflexota bacterium]